MVRLLILLLAGALLAFAPTARAAQPDGIRIWVEVDHDGPIHPQEMVILRVHGRFMVPVTLEKMQDPDFAGFRQIRIDRDRWSEVFEDGLSRRAFQRVVAVFPQRSGRLEVGPFVHHLTILDPQLKQVKVDVATEPVTIEVEPAPAPAGSWWLPASRLTVEETWTNDPGRLGIGQSTRRTIRISAYGLFDDQLPPAPPLKGEGLIVFPGNAERWTKIGLGRAGEGPLPLREQALRRKGRLEEVAIPFLGPFASVAYTWDVRPATDAPVTLPAIEIPWFDTESRTMRTAVIPERTVALLPVGPDTVRMERALGISGETAAPGGGGRAALILAGGAGLVAFAASFGAALALLAPDRLRSARDRLAAFGRRRTAMRRMRSAARRGDAAGVRSVLAEMSRGAGFGRRADGAAEALARLDAHLFGAGDAAGPDLAALARSVRWSRG